MTAALRRWGALLVLMSTAAGPAFGGCKDTWPDAQVATKLAKPGYAHCTLDLMRVDYAEILGEQSRLLSLLRPAYERKVTAESDELQTARLNEYDTKLQKLSAVATMLAATLVPAVPHPGDAAGVQVSWDGPGIWKLAKEGRVQSQALETKIELPTDKFKNDELDLYCKLDFYFRLGDGLYGKLRDCPH